MFRAAALSIALTLTAGPSVGLLCTSWCDTQAAAASGCHHADSGPTVAVAADDECDDAALRVGTYLREDPQRGVSTPAGDRAVSVPRHQLPPLTFETRPWHTSTPRPLERRPLSGNLRI